MSKRVKVLLIAHNHLEIRAGGAEAYTLELYDAMRASDTFEPLLLARTGPPMSRTSFHHPDTVFSAVNDDPNQYLMYSDAAQYDLVFGRLRDKKSLTRDLRDFLLAHRPDVVHFQHTLFIGYDAIRVVKNTLPGVPIVYTLHEYWPICHRGGHLMRTVTDELCAEASPRRCHDCFPEISPQTFFLRERFVKSHLDLVDLFLAPSQTLRDHYLRWGMAEDKIVFEPYGRTIVPAGGDPVTERRKDRFAFFGQLAEHKGGTVLLEAMRLLGPDFPGHLWIHGANLDLQSSSFQAQVTDLITKTSTTVTMAGPYPHSRVGTLMAAIDWVVVPSIWWENSPCVIEEAFGQARPVICSDIGGMAEKVTHNVNGLHFERADPRSLVDVMQHAASTPGLWDALHSQIPATYTMKDHLLRLGAIYDKVTCGSRHDTG